MIQNISQKTRKELVEIVKIQVEEFQKLHKKAQRLESELVFYTTDSRINYIANLIKSGEITDDSEVTLRVSSYKVEQS